MENIENDNTINYHTYGKTVSITELQVGLLPDNIKQCYEEYLTEKKQEGSISKEDVQKLLELWFSKKNTNGREIECESTSDSTNVGYEACDNLKRQRVSSTI
jgi:hypothetical protein